MNMTTPIPLNLPFPAPFAKFVPIEASGLSIPDTNEGELKPVGYLDRVILVEPPYSKAYAWLAIQYPNQAPAILCILEDCIPSKYRRTRGTLEKFIRDAPKHSALQVFIGEAETIQSKEVNP